MNQPRRVMVVLCFVLAVAGVAGAQASGTAGKILALEEKWNQAYRASDIQGMNALLADDFIITIEDGSTYSKPGYIAHVNDPKTKVLVSEMTDTKVRMHGDTAVVTGAYHEKGTTSGKPYEFRDRMTDVWQNVGGKWQVIASHYSIPAK